jgi:hypothetical protein
MTRQARAAGLSAVAVAVVLGIVIVLANPFGTRTGNSPGPHAPTPATTVNPRTAPTPPAQGAYFGAFAQPAFYSQPSKIAAVDSLQRQIGRRLDIVHTYLTWHAPFPIGSDLAFMRQGSILLVSWAGTDTRAIASGADDSWIRQRARAFKATGKPIFLEWRWEMNRRNLISQVHSPADYIAAWDHIRSIFAREHVGNVAWVWCPSASAFAGGVAQAYYPGNNEVDWVCADAYPGFGQKQSFAELLQPFLGWAAHHAKPVMIGEFGVPGNYTPQQRAQWLRSAAQTVQGDPQVKAIVYFDADPTGPQPQLSYSYALDEGSAALQAFRAVADERYFNPRDLPVTG